MSEVVSGARLPGARKQALSVRALEHTEYVAFLGALGGVVGLASAGSL